MSPHDASSCCGDNMPARKISEDAADRLTVTLDAGDRAELERLSVAADRSLAWVVREAIRTYLATRRENRAAG